ncbi:MAG: Flp pilus assembly complex ATPase component TadA [bacterium]|nr:Flp pilus assembly complex ATPase component TadA [bacterium]
MQTLIDRKRIGEWLCEQGFLTAEQLEHALEIQTNADPRPLLGAVLMSLKYVHDDHLTRGLAAQLNAEILDLDASPPDPELKGLVPAALAQVCRIIPHSFVDGALLCAAAGPVPLAERTKIEFLANRPLRLAIASEKAINKQLKTLYGLSVENMIAGLSGSESDARDDQEIFIHDLRSMAQEPTLVNLVNVIIANAISERASDIHVEPFESELRVKYRIDGILQEVAPPPKQFQSAIISRIKIMAGLDIAERYIPQDGQIRVNLPQTKVDIRVSCVPTVYGESVVMRLLVKEESMLQLTQLGMNETAHRRFSELLGRPYGIILVCGPTGSGKTTTLYGALHQIYTPEKKIITIEDPVEYQFQGINQIPVRPKRGLTFASGLRAIVRQDPDIIMVGEVRDKETADIAIRAALTGHLVFSTLHTNDAPGAITRLIDMGVEPFLIASSLEGTLAQRLVRRLCPECRRPITPDPILMSQFEVDEMPERVWVPEGCEACRGRGFHGRIGIFELLLMTETLHQLILKAASSTEIKAHARNTMETMRQDGYRKILEGQTSVPEVLQATHFDHSEG